MVVLWAGDRLGACVSVFALYLAHDVTHFLGSLGVSDVSYVTAVQFGVWPVSDHTSQCWHRSEFAGESIR